MFHHQSSVNQRARSARLAITTCAAIGLMGDAVPATAQEQPNTTAPQGQVVPPQRQPPSPAALARPQRPPASAPSTPNDAATHGNARALLNKLFPGAQPAGASEAGNPATRGMQSPAPQALRQAVATGAAIPGNRAGAPLQMASLGDKSSAARAVQSRTFLGHPGPAGSTETQTRTGNIVRTGADGSVIDVHSPRNGMYIHHASDGNRQILVAHPDGSRVYASSRGLQYVQHPYVFRGRTYDHRTYYVQGQLFHQFYRPFQYGRTVLDVYATPRYYDANFYQWATTRLPTPQPFKWDYVSSSPPWFGYYKGYFTPDTSYNSPLDWLADFVLAASLAANYKTGPHGASPPSAGSGASVTPEVKQMVADEVGRQVRQESLEAQQNAQNRDPAPGAGSVVQTLSDRQTHVFVVASDLDLVDESGRRCMISEGDVVQVVTPPQPANSSADAVVLASKGGGECQRAARVEIALNDLQEMQNHMRETIDQGMANTNAAKKAASVTPAFVASAPPPDPNAAHELDQQQQIAAAIEG